VTVASRDVDTNWMKQAQSRNCSKGENPAGVVSVTNKARFPSLKRNTDEDCDFVGILLILEEEDTAFTTSSVVSEEVLLELLPLLLVLSLVVVEEEEEALRSPYKLSLARSSLQKAKRSGELMAPVGVKKKYAS